MSDELNYLRIQVEKLKEEKIESSEQVKDCRYIIELMEKNEAWYEEKIAILENQIHSRGKKPKISKRPELDWNKKIELIRRYVREYRWESPLNELEKLFLNYCSIRWEGVQQAYDKIPKSKKQDPLPPNVIAFPSGGGAQ